MQNLYWIVNKDGEKIPYKPNKHQISLLANLHNKNLIIKARQLGYTTCIDILALDTALFFENQTVVIIAHTIEHAEKIFKNIVKHAYDNLPEWVKIKFDVDSSTSKKLSFKNNNSTIEVATSARSGTVQFLHVSELGPMAQKFPEKASEIITGSLNAVHQNGLLFIESTAKGREGQFFNLYLVAKKVQESGEKLTPLDYKLFFKAWWEEETYRLEDQIRIPEKFEKYFEKVEEKTGTTLDIYQRGWYVKKSQEMDVDGKEDNEMKSEFPSYVEEAFEASVSGAYYATQMSRARKDGRIGRVPWDPALDVDVWWDLGINDSMFLTFVQYFGREIRIIDCYENSGEGFEHYRKHCSEKPYTYGKHVFPHDIKARNLGKEAESREKIVKEMGFKPMTVAKRADILHGIEKVRQLFPRFYIDDVKAKRVVDCLDNYKKQWDDRLGVWKNQPLHNEYSHGADSVRNGALTASPMFETTVEAVQQEPVNDPFGLFPR